MDYRKLQIKLVSGATQNIGIALSQNYSNIGIYDDYGDDKLTDDYEEIITFTGITENRLSEIEKYTKTDDYMLKYVLYNGNNNGIILMESNENIITYIIDNIKYKTFIDDNLTIYEGIINSNNSINFSLKNIIKIDRKMELVQKVNTIFNINVVRQEISVFENLYRLSNLKSLNKIVNYFDGNYFNVYDAD
jgi:hypothetical protein